MHRNVAADADAPRVKRTEVQVLSNAQIKTLLNRARQERQDATTLRQRFITGRLEALVALSIGTGMRKGEALGLHMSDVDTDAGEVRIRQQYGVVEKAFVEPKTRQSRRTVALPTFALTALSEHLRTQKEYKLSVGSDWQEQGLVFATGTGAPLSHRNCNRDLDALLERAGLPHVSWHSQRHSAASWMLQTMDSKGEVIEVSRTLGHSRVTQTMDTYAKFMPDDRKAMASRGDALFGT